MAGPAGPASELTHPTDRAIAAGAERAGAAPVLVAPQADASRKVFPECFLPTRAELTEASHGLFKALEVRSDPEDGVSTVQSWLERARARA